MTKKTIAYLWITGLFFFIAMSMSATAADLPNEERRQGHLVEELRPISFMIGKWQLDEIYSDDPDNIVEVKNAVLDVRKILNGAGIQIQSTHPYGDNDEVFTAISIFSVRQDSRDVIGISINNLGNRKTLSVDLENDKIEVRRDGELFGGGSGYNLGTYRQISKDSFEYRLDRCMEEEAPCIPNTYSFVAHRIE